jgi:hypothetical protein
LAKQIVINIQGGEVSRDKNVFIRAEAGRFSVTGRGEKHNIKKIFPLDKASEMK